MLQASSDEFSALFNTILINVTVFFRDPDTWEYIATDVIPRLLAERDPDDPIRVWSAGCASGQEAHTLAILLTESLGCEELSGLRADETQGQVLTHSISGCPWTKSER